MKKPLAIAALMILASLTLPTVTAAGPIGLVAPLSGSQEVPPVVTEGRGLFTATLNEPQTQIAFRLTVTGLNLPTITASHIHVGAIGVNGPIILFLFNRATEGTFTGTKTGTLTPANLIPRPAAGVNNFTDAVRMILTGKTYVNVHTDAHPGGEIRGQVEQTVRIDVKPGSDPNSINVKSEGVVPVAILTTTTFDASTVDVSTVRFGRTGTEAAPVQSALEDVDKDGDLDLILHFNTQETGFKAGDTMGTLTGRTLNGGLITASDAVRAFFPGDVNGDLVVDIIDLASVAVAYGSSQGSVKWNLYADFDQNGVIDIIDIATLAFYYGQHA